MAIGESTFCPAARTRCDLGVATEPQSKCPDGAFVAVGDARGRVVAFAAMRAILLPVAVVGVFLAVAACSSDKPQQQYPQQQPYGQPGYGQQPYPQQQQPYPQQPPPQQAAQPAATAPGTQPAATPWQLPTAIPSTFPTALPSGLPTAIPSGFFPPSQ